MGVLRVICPRPQDPRGTRGALSPTGDPRRRTKANKARVASPQEGAPFRPCRTPTNSRKSRARNSDEDGGTSKSCSPEAGQQTAHTQEIRPNSAGNATQSTAPSTAGGGTLAHSARRPPRAGAARPVEVLRAQAGHTWKNMPRRNVHRIRVHAFRVTLPPPYDACSSANGPPGRAGPNSSVLLATRQRWRSTTRRQTSTALARARRA